MSGSRNRLLWYHIFYLSYELNCYQCAFLDKGGLGQYCYASFMKRFTNHPEPWGSFVDVKHWPKINNPQRYAGKELFIGSVTDPYQPLEEIYGRTRALLEQMQGSGCKISIATKSDLILRDLDLIKTFPDAVSVERRLTAMKAFQDAGVRTTCFILPIFRITTEDGLLYVRDDDSIKRDFKAPPIVVNYFFHEEIIPSAKRGK